MLYWQGSEEEIIRWIIQLFGEEYVRVLNVVHVLLFASVSVINHQNIDKPFAYIHDNNTPKSTEINL